MENKIQLSSEFIQKLIPNLPKNQIEIPIEHIGNISIDLREISFNGDEITLSVSLNENKFLVKCKIDDGLELNLSLLNKDILK